MTWNVTASGLLTPLLLYVPRVLAALGILLVFWLFSLAAGKVVGRLGNVRSVDQELIELLGRISRVGLLTFGVITACGTLGVDVTALVTGLGLTGFALGFALKDIISNALSGMLILIYKPFRRGDRISLTGFEGVVVEINLRYTILNGGSQRIFIPNSNLFSNPLVVLLNPPAAAPGTPIWHDEASALGQPGEAPDDPEQTIMQFPDSPFA